jgi:hypothetical protein
MIKELFRYGNRESARNLQLFASYKQHVATLSPGTSFETSEFKICVKFR